MPTDAANAFIESLKMLLQPEQAGPSPRIVYAEPRLEPTLDLLPADWPRELVDPDTYAAAVNAALAETSVVAFPAWGRQKGSSKGLETRALEGLQPGPTGHLLLLVLPFSILGSLAAEAFRVQLGDAWRIRAVISIRGGPQGFDLSFPHTIAVLETPAAPPGVLRMFDATKTGPQEDSDVVNDLRRLLRMPGGLTKYGFVLRETPPAGAPLVARLYHPRLTKRRRELADFGRAECLGYLFEVLGPGIHQLQPRTADTVPAETIGALRVVAGRDILRSHEIAPADETSTWVAAGYPPLQSGDILVRAIQPINAVQPGLVWARVTPDGLPLTAGPQVLTLRPKPNTDPYDVDFALRFISSGAALELANNPGLPPAVPTLSVGALRELSIPVPDPYLKDALASIEQARQRAAAWSEEADDILGGLFDYDDSAIEARQRVLERSRLVRLRMKAVDDVETLEGQIRTQYPLPLAYRWRALQASRSHGNTRDAYRAVLDSAEQTFAFIANTGLALAREVRQSVSVIADIAGRLSRGQGTSMSDWCKILDELGGSRFAQIDTAISTPEFRNFCADPAVKAAREDLLGRRNDDAHGRRVEDADLEEEISAAMASLETINESLTFLLDNPLIVVRSLHWDSIRQEGAISYQVLAGDHPVVPVHQMQVTSPTLEADSLYLLDSKRSLHLLRPFLTGTNCQRCGTFSVFCVDQRRKGRLTVKSLEHGHSIEAPEQLRKALAAVGIVTDT